MKVELLLEPGNPGWFGSGPRKLSSGIVTTEMGAGARRTHFSASRAWPFYKASAGTYVHRVRSIAAAYSTEANSMPRWERPRMCAQLWCGSFGAQNRGALLEAPGESPVCATCEGRAVANGQPSVALLVVRPVAFRPRV